MEYCGFFPKIQIAPDIIPVTNICGFNSCMEGMTSANILCCGKELPQLLRIPLFHRAALLGTKVLEVPDDDIFLVIDENSYLMEIACPIILTATYKPRKQKIKFN